MDRDISALDADRLQLIDKLAALSAPARIRAALAFHPMDDTIFYAEDGVREFGVSVIEDVTWGPDIVHYVEEPDEFRHLIRMTIDVPNTLNGRVATVIENLFVEWFAVNE